MNHDQYMALADFDSYSRAQQDAAKLYLDQKAWSQKSLLNTANAGIFAADRSIADYENTIWLGTPVPECDGTVITKRRVIKKK